MANPVTAPQTESELIFSDALDFVASRYYEGLSTSNPVTPEEGVTEDEGHDMHKLVQLQLPDYHYHPPRNPHQHQRHPHLEFNALRKWANLSCKTLFSVASQDFQQQKLPCTWKPIFNCEFVGSLFLATGFVFLLLGAIIIIFVNGRGPQEFRFPYADECNSAKNYLRMLQKSCVFCGGHNPTCTINIEVFHDMKVPVFVYYELKNFYQSHHSLVKSVDYGQLAGQIYTSDMQPIVPRSSCNPFARDEYGKIYFPCGALANAMFSDSFLLETSKGLEVPLRRKGIAVPVLKRRKFHNSPNVTPENYQRKSFFHNHFVKPKAWTTEQWQEWWKDGGLENEQFVNWMHPSPMPTVRKLYAIIDSVPKCNPGVLCKCNYSLHIDYRFDVGTLDGGDKTFILATSTVMGTRNLFVLVVLFGVGAAQATIGLKLRSIQEVYTRRQLKKLRKDYGKANDKRPVNKPKSYEKLNLPQPAATVVNRKTNAAKANTSPPGIPGAVNELADGEEEESYSQISSTISSSEIVSKTQSMSELKSRQQSRADDGEEMDDTESEDTDSPRLSNVFEYSSFEEASEEAQQNEK